MSNEVPPGITVSGTLQRQAYVTNATLIAGTTGRTTRPFPVTLDPADLTRRVS